MKICSKLAKLGIDGREFFMKIDTDKSGELSVQEFIDGLKKIFNIFLSPEEAE